jgi:hypothetical protein
MIAIGIQHSYQLLARYRLRQMRWKRAGFGVQRTSIRIRLIRQPWKR